MTPKHAVVTGTLQPNGTLALDEMPGLPTGPVQVIVSSAAPPQAGAQGDWWQYLQRARQELESAGASFCSGQEVNAYLDQLRGEWDRIEALYETMDWQKHHGS